MCEIVKKEKEIHARFDVTLQTTEVMITLFGKCIVQMEKMLYFRVLYE